MIALVAAAAPYIHHTNHNHKDTPAWVSILIVIAAVILTFALVMVDKRRKARKKDEAANRS